MEGNEYMKISEREITVKLAGGSNPAWELGQATHAGTVRALRPFAGRGVTLDLTSAIQRQEMWMTVLYVTVTLPTREQRVEPVSAIQVLARENLPTEVVRRMFAIANEQRPPERRPAQRHGSFVQEAAPPA